MRKALSTAFFLILPFISCQKDNTAGSFNYEKDTPVWLQAKIDSISTDRDYYGAKVYRYEWNEKLVYYIEVPISSCFFCELYLHNGQKVQLFGNEFSDFTENKKNKVLIWKWNDE